MAGRGADRPISRREAIRQALLFGVFGGAAIGGLSGSINATGGGETDPLAVLLNPDAAHATQTITSPGSGGGGLLRIQDLDPNGTNPLLELYGTSGGVTTGFQFWTVGGALPQMVGIIPPGSLAVLGSVSSAPISEASDPGAFKTLFSFDDNALVFQLGDDGTLGVPIASVKPLTNPTGGKFDFSGIGSGGLTPAGQGAQVGLPNGTPGAASNSPATALHRHAFSGRFYLSGFLANALAGVPTKFLRFTIANNWTLRRVTAFAQSAPAGGSDSFGVVNAAGTLQGSAVTLAAGSQEAEQTQFTNLTGGTVYYLAETGSTAVTQAVGINVAIEYTMNV